MILDDPVNVAEFLGRHARDRGDELAILGAKLRITWDELERRVGAAASRLARVGIRPGDPLLFTTGAYLPSVVGLLAIARAGGVILSAGGDGSLDTLTAALGRPLRGVLVPAGAPFDRRYARIPQMKLDGLASLSGGPFRAPAPASRSGEPLLAISTSGTTGRPRVFFQTHDHFVWRCAQMTRLLGVGPATRFLQFPMLDTALGRRQMFNMIAQGATLVWPGTARGAALLELMRSCAVTYAMLTPAHLESLVAAAVERGPLFPALTVGVTSAPLTQALFQRARATLTPRVLDVYGCNETGILTLAAPEDRHARPGTVGRPDPGIELEIVDDAGRTVVPGDIGHIRVRTGGMPGGYVDSSEASGRSFVDGWFYPGDMARRDEDGHLHLAGRRDDVINNQGVKFYPAEVESVLREHPAVADAAVMPWPHAVCHQVAMAVVVLRAATPEDELTRFVASRLPGARVPGRILAADHLPRGPAGKIPRAELKALLERLIAAPPGRTG